MNNTLKAPFPYFGGKSPVGGEVWKRFGDTKNYVEPFFGSGAVLLSRPHPPRVETVNDLNAWRVTYTKPMLSHRGQGIHSMAVRANLTAVFLDPPYSQADRDGDLYAVDRAGVAEEVRAWCLEHGDNPDLRIALCGYDSEHGARTGAMAIRGTGAGALIATASVFGFRRIV